MNRAIMPGPGRAGAGSPCRLRRSAQTQLRFLPRRKGLRAALAVGRHAGAAGRGRRSFSAMPAPATTKGSSWRCSPTTRSAPSTGRTAPVRSAMTATTSPTAISRRPTGRWNNWRSRSPPNRCRRRAAQPAKAISTAAGGCRGRRSISTPPPGPPAPKTFSFSGLQARSVEIVLRQAGQQPVDIRGTCDGALAIRAGGGSRSVASGAAFRLPPVGGATPSACFRATA